MIDRQRNREGRINWRDHPNFLRSEKTKRVSKILCDIVAREKPGKRGEKKWSTGTFECGTRGTFGDPDIVIESADT